MNTCSSCKNWAEFKGELYIKYFGPNRGKCSSEKIVYGEDFKGLDDCLLYSGSGIETGGNFGCIHWGKK